MSGSEAVEVQVGARRVRISSPDKPYFPEVGVTKLDLVTYYLDVADALLAHCRDRPLNLERYPDGVGGSHFVQKRVPDTAPPWLQTVEVTFGSGRTARELCPAGMAEVVWATNLGALSVHPWAVRRPDLTQPDELRVDLDPMEGVAFDAVRQAALVVKEALEDHGLRGFPKTSGSRGIHVLVRVAPTDFVTLRRAAVALARDCERRAQDLVTASWWKEERGQRVFLDYNQNLWDRTMACAYSVRPVPDARVSMPVHWSEVGEVDPDAYTVLTAREVLAERGDPMAELDASLSPLDGLLALAQEHEDAGIPDAPWPPHFPKGAREPKRVQPSRAADD